MSTPLTDAEWRAALSRGSTERAQRIAAGREAAAVAAERERLLTRIEELHPPFRIYDECEHEHTYEDVRAGRAFEVLEVGTTCARTDERAR